MMILYEGGVYFMPLNSHPKGESGIRSGIGHQSGKETKTEKFRCIIRKYWMVDKKCFFLWTFLLKVVFGGSETWTKPDFL